MTFTKIGMLIMSLELLLIIAYHIYCKKLEHELKFAKGEKDE